MNTLWLTLKRVFNCEEYCIGRIYADKIYVSDSIEDSDRGLKQKMSIMEILAKKKYGITAIPKGTYEVIPTVSPKFKYRVWGKKYNGIVPEIAKVPGFSGVRIHPATKADELLGCVAPGKNTVKGKVTSSQACYYKLMDTYLVPTWDRGDKVMITIQ